MSAPSGASSALERVDADAHGPRQSLARRLLGPLHFTGVVWYRAHLALARWLPDAIKRPLLWLCARSVYLLVPSTRRRIAANHALVRGPLTAAERRRAVLHTLDAFAWCLTERYERFLPGRDFEVEFEGVEHWRAATEGGRGAILATAHVGMWEAASRLPGDVQQRTVHLVREREANPGAQAFFEALLAKQDSVGYVTHFAEAPTLGLDLLAALRSGALVALQADRPRQGGKALLGELFGEPFELPDGLMALARAARAPILPVFALRVGRRRYRVEFHPSVESSSEKGREEDARAMVAELCRAIEGVVQAAPEQWFRFFK